MSVASMSGHLKDIYPDTLRKHYEEPHNYWPMEGERSKASAANPVCGDEVTVYLKGDKSKVIEATLSGPFVRDFDGVSISDERSSPAAEAGRKYPQPEPRLRNDDAWLRLGLARRSRCASLDTYIQGSYSVRAAALGGPPERLCEVLL